MTYISPSFDPERTERTCRFCRTRAVCRVQEGESVFYVCAEHVKEYHDVR